MRRKNRNIYRKQFNDGGKRKKRVSKRKRKDDIDDFAPDLKKRKQMEREENISSDRGVIKLRQKASCKDSFYYLEQLCSKHGIFDQLDFEAIPVKNGMDFVFSTVGHVNRFLNFITGNFCVKVSKLTQCDYGVEISPICPYNLVCLPQQYFVQIGKSAGPLLLCHSVSKTHFFIDPLTLRTVEVPSKKFFNCRFDSLFTRNELVEYIVLDVRPGTTRTKNGMFVLGSVEVCQPDNMGYGSSTTVQCHFCHILSAGDTVLGYDVSSSNVNNKHLESYKRLDIPPIVLVKKKFGHSKHRYWKIKTDDRMNLDRGDEFEDFKNMLEESVVLRKNVNLYKNENYNFSLFKKREEVGLDVIDLSELLSEMTLHETNFNFS